MLSWLFSGANLNLIASACILGVGFCGACSGDLVFFFLILIFLQSNFHIFITSLILIYKRYFLEDWHKRKKLLSSNIFWSLRISVCFVFVYFAIFNINNSIADTSNF